MMKYLNNNLEVFGEEGVRITTLDKATGIGIGEIYKVEITLRWIGFTQGI
jgi:hypothetical protein